MAITITLRSLGDSDGERGITPETAIQSPAVFNFLVTIDDQEIGYMYSNKVGCSWDFGDAGAKNVLYGPRAGQTTNTLFGSSQAAKVYRVPLGGGIESFTVKCAVMNDLGETDQVSKTIYVKAADYDKPVVAYSATLNTANPAEWVGVPEGATLINGSPGISEFSNKLIMLAGGESFTNNTAADALAVHINQRNFAVTSFGTGRAETPRLMLGARGDGQFPTFTIRDSDIANGAMSDANISFMRIGRSHSPLMYDDLTFVDIDSDWSASEIAEAGSISCLALWSLPYTSGDLTVGNVNFAQKLFIAESVFKGCSVPELGYDRSESHNIFDYTDITGRTVTSFQVEGDGTVYLAGQNAVMTDVGDITINSDGSYVFTAVSGWDEAVNKAVVNVTDNTTAVTKYHIGAWKPVVSVFSLNSSIQNMAIVDVQTAYSREHNHRHMSNQFMLTQDCDAEALYTDRLKHCFTYRGPESASPTEEPDGVPMQFGTSTVNWFGGRPRTIDGSGNRILPGMKYAIRQYCSAYHDSSVDASNPFQVQSVVSSGAGNIETGVMYVMDYGHVITYEDTADFTAEFGASGADPLVDVDYLYLVNITTNRPGGVEGFYADASTSVEDPTGELPLAVITDDITVFPVFAYSKAGTVADNKFDYLRSQGYTGSVNDMLSQHVNSEWWVV